MNETATNFPPEIDEFEVAGLTPVPGVRVEVPRVSESPISMECTLYQTIHIGEPESGGGTLVIGEIVLFHIDDKLYENGRVNIDRLKPLGRLAGAGYTTLGRRIQMAVKDYPLDGS